ncbi:alanine racemase [Granulicella arctica]|uniref:alanine racemase n=1 Tax=Granulicella arctica TaxID=940613 RepID=UPI0021DF6394|nr:alanine racemase [Granulicella arctica]
MKSWIEVSERRLTENYRTTLAVAQQESSQDTALLAVIKANAYGHGAVICAPVLARAGAAWLGVTDAAEGTAVRSALTEAGIELQPRILVMCGCLPEDAAAIVRHGLTPVVWQQEQIQALAIVASRETIAVHLEIDTGMSRQGVQIAELQLLLNLLAATPQLRLDGVMTHFASAEVAGSEQTALQRKQFEAALQTVAAEGFTPAWIHVGNTSAVDNGADGGTLTWLARLAESFGARPMARAGLGLYGYSLPLQGLVASDGQSTARLQPAINPVMTWKTRIVSLSEFEAGARIGYGGTFVAEHRMRLALLPVGYADGLRRELSSSSGDVGGWVMIAGKRALIVGRVSMNLITVDVTDLPDLAVGDEVVVLGEGSTAEDHAALAGTISYEILCGMRTPVVLV